MPIMGFILFIVWSDLNQMYSTYIIGKLTNSAQGKELVSKGAYIRVGLNIAPAILMIFFRNQITNNKIERRIFFQYNTKD